LNTPTTERKYAPALATLTRFDDPGELAPELFLATTVNV
jgi:hypothetical protein